MSEKYIIPVFVPHLGCPNNCTFCNQKNISGQMKNITEEEVKTTIETFLKSFKDDNIEREIAFFGGSFTGIEPKEQEKLLKIAYEYIQQKKVSGIRVSTRPDYIDKEKLKLLKKYGVKTIELGVQSTNDYILRKCKRGHTFDDVKKASKLIRRYGFTLGHQIMVGLPESTHLDELRTAKDLAKLKPKIIRVGLQNTDLISNPENIESEVVAGPYHEAFGQLVEDSIWYDKMLAKIKKFNTKVIEAEILVNSVNVNNVIGHKKENIKKLKDTYDLELKVKQTEEIKPGSFKLNILKTYKDFLDD